MVSKIDKYIPLVKFMGLVFGDNFEIILHDVSKPEASIVAIENSHISGRCIGGPMTDLALRMMEEYNYLSKDFIVNYEGKTKDGRILMSSTYYIKEEQNLVGMICVNHDFSDIAEMENILTKMKKAFSLSHSSIQSPEYSENLDDSILNYSSNLIHNALSHLKVSPQRMSVNEKVSVIRQLDQQGVFNTKGSITQLAEYFSTSKSTIYRYIAKAREMEAQD